MLRNDLFISQTEQTIMNRKNVFFALFICIVFISSFLACSTTTPMRESAKKPDAPASLAASNPDNAEIRAVWVSVLGPGLRSEQEIRDMVDAVGRAHLNVIIAQVRRGGATIYPSDIEPRHAIVRDTPDFDPLATLLALAHDTSDGKNRIDVHAWFNMFKLGPQEDYLDSTPAPIGPLHPDWMTADFDGKTYDELEPGVPAVQEYTAKVIEECLKKYDVDGVNLDFIRYFGDDRGYNPVALERFHKQTGGRMDRPAVDDPAWSDFRREQVSAMVRRVAALTWTLRPNATFSVDATAFGGPGDSWETAAPYTVVYQDWSGWAEKGWVDWVARMGYKREETHADQFRDWADYSRALMDRSDGVIVTIGIGAHFNPMDAVLTQYREAQKRGLGTSMFSYRRPTRGASQHTAPGEAESPLWDALGSQIYPEPVPAPRPVWRDKYGTVGITVNSIKFEPLDNADVELTNVNTGEKRTAYTDGNGIVIFTKLTPGDWKADSKSVYDRYGIQGTAFPVPAGKVVWPRLTEPRQ